MTYTEEVVEWRRKARVEYQSPRQNVEHYDGMSTSIDYETDRETKH